MSQRPHATTVTHFSGLEDPRVDRRKLHSLINVVVIALSAIICGAEGWTDVELFGQAKCKWSVKFLDLSNGIPSHDTFGRVFAALDAKHFQACFASWVQALCEKLGGQVVVVDGKTLRRSHNRSIRREAIHMVSAWATESQLVLAQTQVDEKSSEITAIPAVPKLLDVMGCIVTIDAIGCHKEITAQIVEQGADYVLALKANQGTLYNDVAELFAYAEETDFEDRDYHKTVEKGHGRIEIRECWTTSDLEYFAFLDKPEQWPAFQTIVMVRAERRVGDQVEVETRYFISSLPSDAQQVLAAVRQHWHIENRVHWVLDVTFREDESRIRNGNAAQNMAVLRHMALNLIKREQASRRSIRGKRLKAGWDEGYLTRVLCAN